MTMSIDMNLYGLQYGHRMDTALTAERYGRQAA